MPHKKKRGAPVPPANQPQAGPPMPADDVYDPNRSSGAPFQEQDPKRRLGNYESEGEHALQQPGGKNDANR